MGPRSLMILAIMCVVASIVSGLMAWLTRRRMATMSSDQGDGSRSATKSSVPVVLMCGSIFALVCAVIIGLLAFRASRAAAAAAAGTEGMPIYGVGQENSGSYESDSYTEGTPSPPQKS
jgi:uncharacterized membrane protein